MINKLMKWLAQARRHHNTFQSMKGAMNIQDNPELTNYLKNNKTFVDAAKKVHEFQKSILK